MCIKTDEIELLKRFAENFESLQGHSLIRNKQVKVNTTIKKEQGKEVVVSKHRIEEEALESLLVRLRRFNNASDDIYFPKIINILLKYECDETDIQALREMKKLFSGQGKHAMFKYKNKGEEISEENMFDLYVNGRLFHWTEIRMGSLWK